MKSVLENYVNFMVSKVAHLKTIGRIFEKIQEIGSAEHEKNEKIQPYVGVVQRCIFIWFVQILVKHLTHPFVDVYKNLDPHREQHAQFYETI